jgi:F-box/leucine-rich repeat protein 14
VMPRNQIDDYGLAALQKLADLEYLEVGETTVTGAGLAFAQKGGLKHLKFLGMYSCPLNGHGAKAISSIKSLERISLGNIPVLGDEDFANITQGMKNLKYVYVAQCTNMTGAGLINLKNSKGLEELHINQCSNMGDPVVSILRNFKSLKQLSVNGTAISPKGIAELRNALPDCTIQ